MPEKKLFENKSGVNLPYLVYYPTDYNPEQKYPLVVFLHGYGERGKPTGENLELVGTVALPKVVENNPDVPFILVAPQCPDTDIWASHIETLDKFLSHVLKTENIDTKRLYLTGISMGGMGTWIWAQTHPELFSAIVPVCGIGATWMGEEIKNLPIWTFHGKDDPVIPYVITETIVNNVRANGGNIKFTLYENTNHNSWDKAYAEPTLFDWLLSHHK